MKQADEINALREELARMRERIAVLEARQPMPAPSIIYPNIVPPFMPVDQPSRWIVTCGGQQ